MVLYVQAKNPKEQEHEKETALLCHMAITNRIGVKVMSKRRDQSFKETVFECFMLECIVDRAAVSSQKQPERQLLEIKTSSTRDLFCNLYGHLGKVEIMRDRSEISELSCSNFHSFTISSESKDRTCIRKVESPARSPDIIFSKKT
jgi:hypothetical protein